jgi:hypothetical protein
MMTQTRNKLRTVLYAALGLTTGLTDLQLTIKSPSGITFTSSFVDKGNGVYSTTYTPNILGIYQETVISVSNGDNVVDAYLCVATDTDDLKLQLDALTITVNQIKNALTKGGKIL